MAAKGNIVGNKHGNMDHHIEEQMAKRRQIKYEVLKTFAAKLPDMIVFRTDLAGFYTRISTIISAETTKEFEKQMSKTPLKDRTPSNRKWQIFFTCIEGKDKDIVKLWNLLMRTKETEKIFRFMNEEFQKQCKALKNQTHADENKDTEPVVVEEDYDVTVSIKDIHKIESSIKQAIGNLKTDEPLAEDKRKETMSILQETIQKLQELSIKREDISESPSMDSFVEENEQKKGMVQTSKYHSLDERPSEKQIPDIKRHNSERFDLEKHTIHEEKKRTGNQLHHDDKKQNGKPTCAVAKNGGEKKERLMPVHETDIANNHSGNEEV